MSLIRPSERVTHVHLKKDLTRSIKRGQAWIFSDAIEPITAVSGSTVRMVDRKGDTVGCGIYCRDHPIVIRVCRVEKPWVLDDAWFIQQLERAIQLRLRYFGSETNGYRLVAGEGDGLPGLIVDRYAQTAVIKLDGGSPEAFYNAPAIGQWLAERLGLTCIVYRPRGRGTEAYALVGDLPNQPIVFKENGISFAADVVHGQKTGFFLDQRDNRNIIRRLAEGTRLLNLFSFSGGFSVAAGVGGASQVTSVDVAPQAIQACSEHWEMNGLKANQHCGLVTDCFDYLRMAVSERTTWDIVICDPPSFAPSQQSLDAALSAYTKLAQLCATLVRPGGWLALASCSSHVTMSSFAQANLQGLGKSRRLAQLVAQLQLPIDHPTPLAMPELMYLKFQLLQLN